MAAPPPAKPSSTDAHPHVYESADVNYPPPPYAESSSNARNDYSEPLLGQQRRDSMDNVPEDFLYSSSVNECSVEVRHQFIRDVYSILFVQLLATGVVSAVGFFSPAFKSWIQSNVWMLWISLFGSIGFMLGTFYFRKSYPKNLFFLGGFTLMEAYTVAVIVSFFEVKLVLEAIILTGIVFAALSLFACQTKYDFTGLAPWLFGGLWVLIGFGLVAMFFPWSSGLELAYAGGACLIFSGYILVDTQMIMRHYHPDEAIAASISLYLDVINLFLAILRILNNQNNN